MGLAAYGVSVDTVCQNITTLLTEDANNGLTTPRVGTSMFLPCRPKNLEGRSQWVCRSCFHRVLLLIYYRFVEGFTNSSLYTGDIDYVNMPVQGSYWILPMSCLYFFLSQGRSPFLSSIILLPLCSRHRSRQHHSAPVRTSFLRRHRYRHHSCRGSIPVYFADICPNPRQCSRDGEFPKLLHFPCVFPKV